MCTFSFMSWIRTIAYKEASGRLKTIYDRIKGPNAELDNVLTIHSLRPHTLEGHMALYKATLHHSKNTLPKWYLEAIGVYVSRLNACEYCAAHHAVGIKRGLEDAGQFQVVKEALASGDFTDALEPRLAAGMSYAYQLTKAHQTLNKAFIDKLKAAGLTEGELLEINQVTCYFNYVNRMVVGLGVDLEDAGEIGLSPNSGGDDEWGHS